MTLARMERRIVRELGLHLPKCGELGPPANIPERPSFWKLSTPPGKYYRTHRVGRLKNKQNLYLALAAMAPFESQIESELLKFEMHLRSELSDFIHSPAHYAFFSDSGRCATTFCSPGMTINTRTIATTRAKNMS